MEAHKSAKALGYRGEELAVHFLQSKGYEILGKNFTVRGGEIDVVARQDQIFVFVEVKTRTSESFGEGSESVTGLKKVRLLRAINRYLAEKIQIHDPDYRLDIIEVELDSSSKSLKKINHFEDVEL